MTKRLTTEEYIQKAKDVHGDRYDYSKVKYVRGIDKIIITCLIHGDYTQEAHSHLQNHNCPRCGNISKKNNKS